MSNCPVCGRHIGEFTNDPILVIPSLSTDQYKGYTVLLAKHIEELQYERQQQEVQYGVSPFTTFSPVNIINFFQNIKQYILELRTSTQKILDASGMTLQQFLSTDEDGNPMTSKGDWTDSGLEEISYQCKAIHIEDLRHFISAVTPPPAGTFWSETWRQHQNVPYGTSYADAHSFTYQPAPHDPVYIYLSSGGAAPTIIGDHGWAGNIDSEIDMEDYYYPANPLPKEFSSAVSMSFSKSTSLLGNFTASHNYQNVPGNSAQVAATNSNHAIITCNDSAMFPSTKFKLILIGVSGSGAISRDYTPPHPGFDTVHLLTASVTVQIIVKQGLSIVATYIGTISQDTFWLYYPGYPEIETHIQNSGTFISPILTVPASGLYSISITYEIVASAQSQPLVIGNYYAGEVNVACDFSSGRVYLVNAA